MRTRFHFLLLVLVLGAVGSCRGPGTAGPNFGIQTRFDRHAVLSPRELRSVIELATKCGLSQVAEVYTFNIHPSLYYGISVKSTEITQGRELSYVTAFVNNEKWVGPRNQPTDVLESVGQFWVRVGGIHTNLLTLFNIHGRPAGVRLSGDVALATADRIVELFATGQVRYKDQISKERLKAIDMSQPIELGPSRGTDDREFSIAFPCGELCTVLVSFTLENDGVTVVGVVTIVS
jgi:hypothetical protein